MLNAPLIALSTRGREFPHRANSFFAKLLSNPTNGKSGFKQFQKISTLAGLFHSVLFREAEVNRKVKIQLRVFLATLHPEELWFLKEIDHYPSDKVLEEDYQKLCAFLKISQIKH